jgi:hypothetical protein
MADTDKQYNATLLFYPHLPNREIDTFSLRSSSIALGDDSIIPKRAVYVAGRTLSHLHPLRRLNRTTG